jgi:hypothetical protein
VHRSKLRAVCFQHTTSLIVEERKSNYYVLHANVVMVEWLGHPLAAPWVVSIPNRAKVVDLHDDGVPPRAQVIRRVRVIVR